MKQPNNQHSPTNPVGRFMVATGSIIINEQSGKMLLTQRAATQDWLPNEWEISYGRMDQHEDPEQGLRREIAEELGIVDLKIQQVLRVWHIYRGAKAAANDLIGITFVSSTPTETVKLSHEHQAFKWVTPAEALTLVTVDGIRKDIEAYIQLQVK